MASVYNYQTGVISFDFKLKKCDGVCRRLEKPPVKIGNDFCLRCKSHVGMRGDYVMCKYHNSDDEGADKIYRQLREELKHEALCALCY